MTNRIVWIDYAKMICIFLMVCGHAGMTGVPLTLSYQFHMPVFFIISGMLYHPKGSAQTLKQYGIPILAFGVLYLCYRCMLSLWQCHFDPSSFFARDGAMLSQTSGWLRSFLFVSGEYSVFPGHWFVLTLLLIRLLMNVPLLRRYVYPLAVLCLLWCCLQPLIPSLGNSIRFIPYYCVTCLPFYALGLFIQEHGVDPTSGPLWVKVGAALLFCVIALFQGRPDMYDHCFGKTYLLFFLNACLGGYLLAGLCSFLPRRRWVEMFSTGTFLILGVHGILVSVFNSIGASLSIPHTILPILTAVLVMGVCYPSIVWLDRRAPLLLGKSARSRQHIA